MINGNSLKEKKAKFAQDSRCLRIDFKRLKLSSVHSGLVELKPRIGLAV